MLGGRRGPLATCGDSYIDRGWHLGNFFAFAEATFGNYASGVRAFRAWYSARFGARSQLSFPVPTEIVCAWLDSYIGILTESTVRNKLAGLRALHGLLQVPWTVDVFAVRLRIAAVARVAPKGKDPRPPVLGADMRAIIGDMDLENPFDSSCAAAAALASNAAARLAELLAKGQYYSKRINVQRRHLHFEELEAASDGSRKKLTCVTLPWDKTNKFRGSTLCSWDRPSEGFTATDLLRNHLAVNDGIPADAPLFAYRGTRSYDPPYRYLTRDAFVDRCNKALRKAGREPITGHSFRIGGATSLLLAGVDPALVKAHGRWKSDEGFMRYWRHISGIIDVTRLQQPKVAAVRKVPFA
jgi:hypothetical protein